MNRRHLLGSSAALGVLGTLGGLSGCASVVPSSARVVVVGGGLTGSDCAYFLARQGKRVSLINNSQVLVSSIAAASAQIKAGKLKALAEGAAIVRAEIS